MKWHKHFKNKLSQSGKIEDAQTLQRSNFSFLPQRKVFSYCLEIGKPIIKYAYGKNKDIKQPKQFE